MVKVTNKRIEKWRKRGYNIGPRSPEVYRLAEDLLSDREEFVAALEEIESRLQHWPRDGQGEWFVPERDAHSAYCPRCGVRTVLEQMNK